MNETTSAKHQGGGAATGGPRRRVAPPVGEDRHQAVPHRAGGDHATPGDQGDRLLTTAEVAERIGMRPRRVREYARAGRLPHVRLNRRDIRFHWPTVVRVLHGAGAQ